MASKKGNYITKKVKFQGKDMTMYSLDGLTWSTRPDELQSIIDRHSTEQAAFSSDLKGEEREKEKSPAPKPQKKFAKVHNDDEIDEVIEEDLLDEELEEDLPPPEDDDLDVEDADTAEGDEAPVKAKGKGMSKSTGPVAAKISAKSKKVTKPVKTSGKSAPKTAPKAKAKVAPKAKKAAKAGKKAKK